MDDMWPPQSVREALLSSPSGRKRFADLRDEVSISPLRQQTGPSALLEQLRSARNGERHSKDTDSWCDGEEDEEEDEETLQLKLAAIEAKLKLKKLQNKTKKNSEILSSMPESMTQTSTPSIQVALSPTKRALLPNDQKSPSRILLGIDKGKTGADISLRRAKSIGASPSRHENKRSLDDVKRPKERSSMMQDSRESRVRHAIQIKSFSERMAEVRGQDKEQADRRDDAVRARTKKFNLDAAEVDGFRIAATNDEAYLKSRSPCKTDSRNKGAISKDSSLPQNAGLRKVKTLPNLRQIGEEANGDASLFEGFSELHLASRILPHSFLKRTLSADQYTIYKIPQLLKNVTSPAYEIPDNVGDFVVFGIIASKSTPFDQKTRASDNIKTSSEWDNKWDDGLQNRKRFMVLTLTDLTWTIDLFLFDTALPRYHRLTPGTVIAILNPSIMPPKRGRENTGAFNLALHDGDDTVLEIGMAKDLGHCNAIKKDGKECGQWVNAAKTEICEWHLNAQIAKTQAKRMGVNAGTNGFGGRRPAGQSKTADSWSKGGYDTGSNGLLPTKNGRGFDRTTGSHYFVSSSRPGGGAAPIYNKEVSTARMLDLDNGAFVAEGQFQRDKEALLQKRMASQAKERDIAKKLADLGHGNNAGADYMRRRVDDKSSFNSGRDDVRRRMKSGTTSSSSVHPDSGNPESGSQRLKIEIGRKREAQDVRLSPVRKKTRFLTEKGIKKAGRESTGPGSIRPLRHESDDYDDDDLDIIETK